MARGGIRKGTATVAAGSVLLWAAAAVSQQASPQGKAPPRLVFNLTSGLNADSNRNLQIGSSNPSTTLDTRTGLTYSSQTRLQKLDASLNALWRLGSSSGGTTSRGTGLQEPTARLSYSYYDGENRLTLKGNYRRSQVNQFAPLVLSDGTLSPTDLIATTGDVISWGAQFGFETGLRDPIGFSLSASTDRRHYLNNTDPAVYDTRSKQATATTRFTIDPLDQLDLSLGYSDTRYENIIQTHRQQRRLSLGYKRELSHTLSFNGEIGYSRNRTDEILGGAPFKTTSSGLFGSLGLSEKLRDGTASVSVATQRDSVGVRNTLQAGRTLVLPNAKLEAEAGVTARPGSGAQVIGQLRYSLIGPTDSFTANVARRVTLDANNVDVAYTSLGLGYDHKVNRLSSLGLNLNLNHSGAGGLGAVQSIDRQTLRATYSYALTEDWKLNAGYVFRHLNKAAVGTATSNAVFVNIGRSFTLVP